VGARMFGSVVMRIWVLRLLLSLRERPVAGTQAPAAPIARASPTNA